MHIYHIYHIGRCFQNTHNCKKRNETATPFLHVLDLYIYSCSRAFCRSIWVICILCGLIVMIELLLFRELVRVRYSSYYQQIHNTIPLFRTTQWLWFAVAISYTYGDFVVEILQNNSSLHHLIYYTHYLPTISFVLYSGTFVLTIITLQRDSIKFQINQLCWTILVLCLTVGQLKYIMHNIFNGLIWFVLPCCLVFTNDIMAYVSGVSCGRKFIHRPFISFSPNKTWEGFIGGWFFTMIVSWHLSRYLAQYTWMTCPMYEFRWYISEPLSCDLDPTFLPAQSFIPSQIFELLPIGFVKIIFPNIVEICAVRPSTSNSATINTMLGLVEELTPCISGESTHQHHHFELYRYGIITPFRSMHYGLVCLLVSLHHSGAFWHRPSSVRMVSKILIRLFLGMGV